MIDREPRAPLEWRSPEVTLLSFLLALAWAGVPPPQIDEPLELGGSAVGDAAVVIANEDYLVLPDVPYAARDGELVEATLVRARGVPAEHVVRLTGANREQILQAVDEAAAHLGEGGTLWVYFAGHGAASPSNGELLLVGDDAKQDPVVFASRSVPVSDVRARVKGRVVFILDTCYAGVGRSGEQLVPGTRFAVPAYSADVSDETVVWTAAGPDEISGPYGAARHGLFTYFAMGALRGWADGIGDPADGAVTLAEGQAYVAESLRALQVFGQHPALTGSWDAPVVESRRLEVSPRVVGFAPPAALALDAKGSGLVIPAVAARYTWPLSRREGKTYVDAYNAEMKYRKTVFDIAQYDRDGEVAVRRWRSSTAIPYVAIPFGLGAGYVTYLATWDLTAGHNLERSTDGALLASGLTVLTGMAAWEVVHVFTRPSARRRVEEAANRVVRGEGL